MGNLRNLSVIAVSLAFFCAGLPAHAQNNTRPPVEIDISVLDNLDPSDGQEARPQPPLLSPKTVVSFPVKTIIRSESVNPSLEKTRRPPPAKISLEVRDNLEDDVVRNEILTKPASKASHKANKAKKSAALKNTKKIPPIPGHRPPLQQASESFVAQAREKAGLQPKKKAERVVVPGGGGPVMPAVPAIMVDAEKLPPLLPALKNDPLAQQLLTPDRQGLAAVLETGSGKIPPAAEKKPSLFEKLISIRAKPMGRAVKTETDTALAKTFNTVKPSASRQEDVAHIKTAASLSAGSRIPRPPPKEDYELESASLPFKTGHEDIDKNISAALQDRILPLLRNNPDWRLQIQTFASPDRTENGAARRISLARAIAIRKWLLEKGIESRRLEIRALGAETDRKPVDRADMIFFDSGIYPQAETY